MAAVWARSSSRCMTAHAGGAIGVSIVRSERLAVGMARMIQEIADDRRGVVPTLGGRLSV